ncbi:hypothetical protein F383_09604 [Gossypium arboreum]|uniref:Uncharacterized protein n=1 Tax=Gossypium arboreum TaxID=29729 RepID=A0A0B0PQZ9_GOSAR|nr:hypothetical protein F383_09604 [Gossypium arboreum]
MLTPFPFHFLTDHRKSEILTTLSAEEIGIVEFIFLNMACIGLKLYHFVSLRISQL